jgi:hypothetical protein
MGSLGLRMRMRNQDTMGYTSWGAPLSNKPTNAVVYNPDDYSDESEDADEVRRRELLKPTPASIASAMEKVEWVRDVVDRMAPASIIAGAIESCARLRLAPSVR